MTPTANSITKDAANPHMILCSIEICAFIAPNSSTFRIETNEYAGSVVYNGLKRKYF